MLETDDLIDLEILAGEELARLEGEHDIDASSREAVSPDQAIGRLSRLDAMQMQEVAKEAARQREIRIHRLRDALRKMDLGEFGLCTACGEWIELERLRAQPEILQCGACVTQ
jgi:DnaK suppressor protein